MCWGLITQSLGRWARVFDYLRGSHPGRHSRIFRWREVICSSFFFFKPATENLTLTIQSSNDDIQAIRGKRLEKMKLKTKMNELGFPGGSVVNNPLASAGDMGSTPDLERPHMPRNN